MAGLAATMEPLEAVRPDRVPLSVVIMSRDEAMMIGRCIGAVASWVDDVVVLDSGSTDGTREIAAAAGARVFEQPWLGFSAQRNRAVALARHDWVLCLDADEVVDARLAAAIRAAILAGPDPRDGFALDRRDEFFGRLFPNLKNRARRRAFIRLFHRGHGRWNPDQLIHEEVTVPGRSIPLPGVLLHWRSFTMAEQLHRYLGNAELEVAQMMARGQRGSVWRMILQPPLRFLWCYVACGGWRMGEAGLVQGMMVAHAEWLRWAMLWERQRIRRVPHPPPELVAGKDG
ncbi:glycosyltransferase family 2 protein [Siccirubricoccus deserti]|uniref:Glycosyltransferase family 2 protein n=1 Tax=Siccirubricoccus deserti TaxID=2013562 RepID=A0A9X0UE09_9PROT|nr:glycosyltransferase family 2 protein [Siccirubricoccus deserti]MBC4016286.1 glycosyltransferase family 2 protein [Siccirubricoccus deserti]